MALWNKVLAGFDREEETVNFGARTVTEHNGSLYETSTIATVQSDGAVAKEPKVSAFVQYSRLCIAIDKSITIFNDETCERILLNVGFGSLITCFSISKNGLFLFVVLTNGVLYCLHLLNKGKVIFSRNVSSDRDIIIRLFLQEDCDCINVNLVALSGAVYRISNLNAKLADMDDDNKVQELAKEIQCLQLFKGFSHSEVIYTDIGIINKDISIAMICSNMIFMWPNEHFMDFTSLSYKYVKVKFLKNSVAMVCLRSDHILNMVCPQTLLGLKIFDKPVLDFAIIENNDTSLQQIVILTAPADNQTTRILHLISFPELEQKFQISVPITTYLVEITDPCDETLLFLEGVSDDENIDTIRIKTVLESVPDYQLQRLLRREQFDAAENFANKFNLSLEPIYCKKAAIFISQLGPWAKKGSNPIELDTLIGILDKIQNVQYVVECCSKVLIPEYKQMKKIHFYARTRIIENTEKMKSNNHLNLLYLINNMLHKLETFHMIWGCQRDTESYDDDTMKEWIRFSQANFLDEYKIHLSLGELEAATLIWTRHVTDIMKRISIKSVPEIFSILPETISPSSLWPWLTHFIPSLLSLIPDAMSQIILWGCKKIRSLEQSHRNAWPQIGIDFANKFIKLLRIEEGHQSLYIHQEYLNQNSDLTQFVLLMQALSDVQKLKVNYRLTIPLNLYIGKPVEVSHILLDKIHVDAIPDFVNTFLNQYMMNNSLKNDYVLSSYIQKTVKYSKSWWSWEEAPWEKRVVAIISLIHNTENKLQETLDVLKRAPVPWSSTMVTLAETSSNFDHVLSLNIRAEYNYVPIKLILKKYGYERIGINDNLIYRIIKENSEDMGKHIHQLTKTDFSLKKKAFSLCINYYLSRGNFKKVMEIVKTLEDNILLYCCEQIVNYVTACMTMKNMPTSAIHYIEMLGWIKFRLDEISKRLKHQAHHCKNVAATIDEMKSLYLLRKEFQMSITVIEYHTKKKEVLHAYIKELCNADMEKDCELLGVYKKAVRMADLLKLQRLDTTFLLLDITKDASALKYFAGFNEPELNVTAEDCRNISKMCLSTLEHGKMDANIAAVVKRLSASTLCLCADDELTTMLLTNVWVNLYMQCFSAYLSNCADMTKGEMPRANWKLYTVYKDLSIAGDQLLLPLFRETISIQRYYTTNSNSGEENNLSDNNVQTNSQNTLQELLNNTRKLEAEHNDYSVLQIIKNLYFSLCSIPYISSTTLIEIRTTFLYFLITLLRKLVSARTFDLHLGLSCLLMLPEVEACKWISLASKSFQTDYARHLTLSLLGYEYFRVTKNLKSMQTFKNFKLLHYWAQRLSRYSVSYKEILTSDATTKREILQRVMHCQGEDILPLLEHFCRNFGFNVQDCLLLYLQTLMTTWNPKLNISTTNSRKELHIDEDEVNELRKMCNAVINKIPDKTVVKNCLNTMRPHVNFYHYEIFMILMDIIEDKNTEYRNYFCFLQNYTRTGQPTQIERDEWMHLNPGHTSLPPIAQWRLPFLPKIELWNLITPELNLKTYEEWLNIAPILKLQPHIVCTLAIKGEVTSAWGNVTKKHKSDKWTLYPKKSSLLNGIKKCIEQMTGPDALYYGTAALYYVVNHTPPGADQVAAAQACYTHAHLSAQKSTTFEEGMLEKIKLKYLRFTSEHILRTHGLGTAHYLSLIGNPKKLLRELYTDESIPQRYRCVADHRPDINSAVAELSELFSINLFKLRIELLQEWLQPDSRYMEINQSMTDTFSMATNTEQNANHDDNLLRICYMLEYGDLTLSANFLINIGFSDNNDDYNPEVRYRALHVLQIVIEPVILEDLTKRDLKTIRQYMKSLKYIGKLESLGLSYSVNTFETCSKKELVQILWNTQSYSPQALVIISQICIDFEIYEYSLWDKNLSQLAKLSMMNELKRILLQVRNISIIINSNGYLLGWQAIISDPFKKLDVNPSSEQIDHCIEALRLLYSCPVIHMLHFTDIINYCFQCQQPHLVAALLPFLNDADKKQVLQTIKRDINITKIQEDMNNLSLHGVLCISHCSKIIKEALEETDMQ